MCLCPIPLLHERTTVYDKYFTDFQTEVIDGPEVYDGFSFIEYLKGL